MSFHQRRDAGLPPKKRGRSRTEPSQHSAHQKSNAGPPKWTFPGLGSRTGLIVHATLPPDVFRSAAPRHAVIRSEDDPLWPYARLLQEAVAHHSLRLLAHQSRALLPDADSSLPHMAHVVVRAQSLVLKLCCSATMGTLIRSSADPGKRLFPSSRGGLCHARRQRGS